jgi:hypothetical protein
MTPTDKTRQEVGFFCGESIQRLFDMFVVPAVVIASAVLFDPPILFVIHPEIIATILVFSPAFPALFENGTVMTKTGIRAAFGQRERGAAFGGFADAGIIAGKFA